jgi:hypothetical protein
MNVIFSIRRPAIVTGALVTALCMAGITQAQQAQTPPSQPPYPSSQQKRVVTPAQRERAAEEPADTRRCDQLKGLEKSECQRRDTDNDDAPAGVTPSMREKEEKARAEEEVAASTTSAANPRSDTAGARTPSAPRPDDASADDASDTKEKADTPKEPTTESDTESDTLDKPKE